MIALFLAAPIIAAALFVAAIAITYSVPIILARGWPYYERKRRHGE